MRKLKFLIAICSIVSVFAVSCKQDFLNTKPLDKISSEATWGDGALAEAFTKEEN